MRFRSSSIIMSCLLLFLSTLYSGCARLYDGFQAQSVESCYNLPYSEQQDCLDRVRSTREKYEQDRKTNQLR
jgi:hypothetical protein